MKRDKGDSREVGLEILYLILRYHPGSRHLHYGYWDEGLPRTIANLPQAQEAYCDFLLSHIPEGTRTILDVGCGVGGLARRLVDAGYQVECISPSSAFKKYAIELLGEGTPIHECYFEDFPVEKTYDLVLFSESFQYVKAEEALQNAARLLRVGGHLMISDFFKTGAPGKSPIGGGCKIRRFQAALEGKPLRLVEDVDITDKTAPTMEIMNEMLLQVAVPARDRVFAFLRGRHPLITRFLEWKFRKKLAKIETKYLSGARDAATFAIYKTYRLFVFEKLPSETPADPAPE